MRIATADLMDAYLTAWETNDWLGIKRHIHPKARFKAPMLELNGHDRVTASLVRFSAKIQEFQVRSTFVSGDAAMFAFDLLCEPPIGACAMAELVTFEDGLVKTIELFCDAKVFALMVGSTSDSGD
jgi:hypothetical protein